jgi:hypothetical protein
MTELADYRGHRLASKRPMNRAALAQQNPVSVVGGGATVGGGAGTGSGVSQSPGQGQQRFYYYNNYQPWYWPSYNNWYGYYPWWQGFNYGWPVGYGFNSPVYWPQWPQQWWPGPYAYAPRRVVAVT